MHDRLTPRKVEAGRLEARDELVLVQRVPDTVRHPALGRRAPQLVDDHHRRAPGDQVRHQVAADEAGAPGHDDHGGRPRAPPADRRRRAARPRDCNARAPLTGIALGRTDACVTGPYDSPARSDLSPPAGVPAPEERPPSRGEDDLRLESRGHLDPTTSLAGAGAPPRAARARVASSVSKAIARRAKASSSAASEPGDAISDALRQDGDRPHHGRHAKGLRLGHGETEGLDPMAAIEHDAGPAHRLPELVSRGRRVRPERGAPRGRKAVRDGTGRAGSPSPPRVAVAVRIVANPVEMELGLRHGRQDRARPEPEQPAQIALRIGGEDRARRRRGRQRRPPAHRVGQPEGNDERATAIPAATRGRRAPGSRSRTPDAAGTTTAARHGGDGGSPRAATPPRARAGAAGVRGRAARGAGRRRTGRSSRHRPRPAASTGTPPWTTESLVFVRPVTSCPRLASASARWMTEVSGPAERPEGEIAAVVLAGRVGDHDAGHRRISPPRGRRQVSWSSTRAREGRRA